MMAPEENEDVDSPANGGRASTYASLSDAVLPVAAGMQRAFQLVCNHWIERLRAVIKVPIEVVEVPGSDTPMISQCTALCGVMAQTERTSLRCRHFHRELRCGAVSAREARCAICPNDCEVFAVPVLANSGPLGLIEGGRVFTEPRSESQFWKLAQVLGNRGGSAELQALRAAYFSVPSVPAPEVAATLGLLRFIATRISQEAEAEALGPDHSDPPAVARARKIVAGNLAARLSVTEVAREVCLSKDHFSKLFKHATGIPFTEYLGRMRTARGRSLLQVSSKRITEVAFECGFESISHFNRIFKRYTGVTPTAFRHSKRAGS